MSRIVGIIFHYPAPRKPVLRPRLDLRSRALSSRSSNVDFERISYSASWAPTSWLRTSSIGAPVTPCSKLTKVEQAQHTSFPENIQRPHAAQPSQHPVLMHPQFFLSSLQVKQPVQTHYTQFPAFHTSSYPEQHIPIYGPQITFPALQNAPELPFACPEAASCSTAFQQHPSEHMDIVGHRQLIPEPPQKPQEQSTFTALESSHHPQNQPAFTQFSDAPQAQFSNYPPGFSSPHCSFSQSSPVVEYMSTSPSISHLQVRPLPSYEPGIMAPISQSRVMQPVQNHTATETLVSNVLPDTATPHSDFSCHPTWAPPPYSDSPESTPTGEMLFDVGPVWQPAASEYAPAQPLDPKPQAPSASPSHLSEVMPRPSSPVAGDNKDASDSEESESGTSDSDYSGSSSEEDDSDSDSDSSDDSDEEEAATTVGPSG